MKFLNYKYYYLSITFIALFFPKIAYSFPVAEGVSALGTLLGVLTSIIVGVSPKFIFSKNKNNKAITISIVLFISLLIALGIIIFNNSKKVEEIETAIQSRPVLINNVIAFSKTNLNQYNFKDYENYVQDNLQILFKLEDYYKGNYSNYSIVNIDYKEKDLSQYPNKVSLINFDVDNPENFQALVELVEKKKGLIILISNNTLKSFDVSKRVYEQTQYALPVIEDFKINYTVDDNSLNNLLSKKGIELQDNEIFNKDLIDLRSLEDVTQTHTLENANVLSIGDLYNMTDDQIRIELNKYKEPIFISFNESDYLIAEHRLKNIKDINYSYLKGGLNNHFDKGNTLTLNYINLGRYLDPVFVMQEYAKDENIKFICTQKEYCLDNLPKEDTIFLSYREMGKNKARSHIKSLDNNNRYILISNNQETDGNALLTGYWLSESGKNFMGILPLPDRFSLEYIRHRIIDNDNISLQDYRENFNNKYFTYLNFQQDLKNLIDKYDWLFVFIVLGLVFRLTLIYFQFNIYKCYYHYRQSVALTLISSFVVICSILVAFNILNNFLINYAVIDHRTLRTLNESEFKDWVALFFVSMVVIQAYITFPVKKFGFYLVSFLVITVYLLGYITSLHTPILVFLTASEFVSIVLQFPFYFKFKSLFELHKKGLYKETFKYMPKLPNKWLLVNQFNKSEGVLINLNIIKECDLINYLKVYLNKNNLYSQHIIRSCSLDEKENELAGFYESIIVNPKNIMSGIKTFMNKKLDFIWIQPYYQTSYNGVMQSYYNGTKNIAISRGLEDASTEGAKNSKFEVIVYKRFLNFTNKEVRFLKKIERFYKKPVTIEYGVFKNKLVLYQVRLINKIDAKHLKLNNYQLAESFITKATYMTGSIIEYISNGDFQFFRGFLYEKKKRSYKRLFSSKKCLLKVNQSLDEIEHKLTKELFPITYYYIIESLIKEYAKAYKLSQTMIYPKYIYSEPLFLNKQYSAINGNELEIFSEWQKNSINCDIKKLPFRELNHYLIVRINYLLNITINKYAELSNIKDPFNISIEELLSDEIKKHKAFQDYAAFPIDNIVLSEEIIVPGLISGKVLLIDPTQSIENNLLQINTNEKYLLVGEEISSGWVKYLNNFSGIVSIFGHPLSHIAISAKELNIPYIKVKTLPKNGTNFEFDVLPDLKGKILRARG